MGIFQFAMLVYQRGTINKVVIIGCTLPIVKVLRKLMLQSKGPIGHWQTLSFDVASRLILEARNIPIQPQGCLLGHLAGSKRLQVSLDWFKGKFTGNPWVFTIRYRAFL